jgi:adhesin HecA-like repeat protein
MTTVTAAKRLGTAGRADQNGVLPPLPVKLRRRPALVVAALALMLVGALVSAWAYTSLGNTQEVVVARVDVPRGQVITADDLRLVRIGVDPSVSVVSASQAAGLVGQRAAVDLRAGQMLVPGSVTAQVYPQPGMSTVGLSLLAAQLPSEPLRVGDRVRVVSTPGAQGDVSPSALVVFDGVVVAVSGRDASGSTDVTVQVESSVAAEVAARSATGKVALVVDSRVR